MQPVPMKYKWKGDSLPKLCTFLTNQHIQCKITEYESIALPATPTNVESIVSHITNLYVEMSEVLVVHQPPEEKFPNQKAKRQTMDDW